jgi:hypothetical protein
MAMGALAAAMATGGGDEIALKSGGVGGGGEDQIWRELWRWQAEEKESLAIGHACHVRVGWKGIFDHSRNSTSIYLQRQALASVSQILSHISNFFSYKINFKSFK